MFCFYLEKRKQKKCTGKPLKHGGYEVLHETKNNKILHYYCDDGYVLKGYAFQPCSGKEDRETKMPRCASKYKSKI